LTLREVSLFSLLWERRTRQRQVRASALEADKTILAVRAKMATIARLDLPDAPLLEIHLASSL
jgi:hypothetical protein